MTITNPSRQYLNTIKDKIIDKQANELISSLHWIEIEEISEDKSDLYPIVFSGKGPEILLLHGFDSCFLEFRRLTPLLNKNYKLIIPDLYGFGFCPRPTDGHYGQEAIINHLNEVLRKLPNNPPIGLIGASMGGPVAMEVARRNPEKIHRLLLRRRTLYKSWLPKGSVDSPEHHQLSVGGEVSQSCKPQPLSLVSGYHDLYTVESAPNKCSDKDR